MSGWIKLHRSLLEWEWWDDHNASRLLIFLLVSANYEEKKWKGITIKPGSLVTSFDKLANALGMTKKQVRSSMQKLENSGEVARERAREGQLVTLVKWEKLQGWGEQEGTHLGTLRAREGHDEGTQRATTKESKEYKEGKEVKKEQEVFLPFQTDVFRSQWQLWKQYRKQQHRFTYKSPASEQAALTELGKMSGSQEKKAIAILHHTMAHGWRGFVEPKEEDNSAKMINVADI